MKTYSDIIARWPSIRSFADEIGVRYVTAQVMKHRDSIAPEHWKNVVNAADNRGFDDVTLELLASLAANRKSPNKPPRRRSRTGACAA